MLAVYFPDCTQLRLEQGNKKRKHKLEKHPISQLLRNIFIYNMPKYAESYHYFVKTGFIVSINLTRFKIRYEKKQKNTRFNNDTTQ
ncbi:MAG: hypothetical protein DRP56_06800 [Planctomycetota bacterium]|nr:MAG: hypothetical protein DRP56_06800 [Planctomycetota bacterium]